MNSYSSQAGTSSTGPSMVGDLDGYTFPSNDYYPSAATSYLSPPDNDEFGFDPPTKTGGMKQDNAYAPTNPSHAALPTEWPGFEREEDNKQYMHPKMSSQPTPLRTEETIQDLSALSRYGQVTPPRSNSASSVEIASGACTVSPKTGASSTRRSGKRQEGSTASESKPARKRKAYRKSDAKSDQGVDPEDDKRKLSLEKNRLAAAKCRVNKKEKTEQLQRDSHEKAVQNAFLKDTVVRMKEEIQHMNALLIAHSSSDGCKKPDELHRHLSQVGQDYFSHHHVGMQGQAYSTYATLARQLQQQEHRKNDRDPAMSDGYFSTMASSAHDPALLSNPPLPEFNQSADFDVRTPLAGD